MTFVKSYLPKITTKFINFFSRRHLERALGYQFPATKAIHAAISGSASSVGSSRITISAAKIIKPANNKNPENVMVFVSQ